MKNYYGVIESRADPKQLGRVRVRVLGIHTEDKVLLPTSDLPWATVLSHDGSNSGLGTTPSFFVEGTWVLVGFFDDDMHVVIKEAYEHPCTFYKETRGSA